MISYHASHEQFKPSELLRLVLLAGEAGFDGISCSDHFYPWSRQQGESGFSFAWLGAAMQATTLPFGVVCAPGQRYHPAVVAQAAATLSEMFPGRFWMALGSGEALNEKITGEPWPDKPTRNQRLYECALVIRRLLGGEEVTADSTIKVHHARLYTLPEQPPFLLAAAVSEDTARWLGSWADGMITTHGPHADVQKKIDAFREGGGWDKPVYLKVQLSYARTYKEALEGAFNQWRTNVLPREQLEELSLPEAFDAAAEAVRIEDIENVVHISDDLGQHVEWIRQYLEMGVDQITLHNVNRQQDLFIRDFKTKFLPLLKR